MCPHHYMKANTCEDSTCESKTVYVAVGLGRVIVIQSLANYSVAIASSSVVSVYRQQNFQLKPEVLLFR